MFNIHENDSKIRIIYAGARHSYHISSFLEEHYNIKMRKYGNMELSFNDSMSRCIKVDINRFLEDISLSN